MHRLILTQLVFVVAALLACPAGLDAQTQIPRPTRKEKMVLFADLVGTWDLTSEHRLPNGQRATYRGTREHTAVLDGVGIRVERSDQLVQADAELSHLPAQSASISYMTYNPLNGLYEICDLFSTMPNRMIVTTEPLTYRYNWEYFDTRTGAQITAQSRTVFSGKDAMKVEIIYRGTDGSERIYTAELRRRSSP